MSDNMKEQKKPDPKKAYWFTIDTYVHGTVKKNWVVLYNSLNGACLEYRDQPEIAALAAKVLSTRHQGVVRLTGRELKKEPIARFVTEVRREFMGDLLDINPAGKKPLQLLPRATIKDDFRLLKMDDRRSMGENIKQYLSEISIYLDSRCNHQCDLCHGAYRQFLCCTNAGGGKGDGPDIGTLRTLIGDAENSRLENVNILGGNIFQYPHLDELVQRLASGPYQKTYFVFYKDAAGKKKQLERLLDRPDAADPRHTGRTRLKIPVTFPLDTAALARAAEHTRRLGLEHRFLFILRGEAQFEELEPLVTSLQIADCAFLPYYDGSNLDFFRENVFTEREDIFGVRPPLKDIYTRARVNPLNFGRLTLMSGGNIHANVNAGRLGVLGRDSLYDVLFKELRRGRGWRRVRAYLEPCKKCPFYLLCPPVTDYTFALGRNNLCTIWPQ